MEWAARLYNSPSHRHTVLASTRNWRLFGAHDLVLAFGVLTVALSQPSAVVTPAQLAAFAVALAAGLAVLYAVLLAFTA